MTEIFKSQKNNPLVSVIIPVYNCEKFLAETIESVAAQTYPNWELILVDDGSTDQSAAIASRFAGREPSRIFLYSHENQTNRGASSSRNLGVKRARGEFITFLDADDVFLPDTLALEISTFEVNPQADAVCGTLRYWFSWTGEGDRKERDFFVNLGLPPGKLYEPPAMLVHNLRSGGRKPGIGCIIIRRHLADQFSLFEEDFKYVSEDQVFWAKICLHGRVFLIDDFLAKYRQHPQSSSAILQQSGNLQADRKKFTDWLENYLAANKIENAEIARALQHWHRENNYRAKYRRLMTLYQRIFPFFLRYKIRDLIVKWRRKRG